MQNLSKSRRFGTQASLREQQASKGKVRSRWGSCLLLLHLSPLAGNKQSFSTDRYMLNHCYLCFQINQITDYSSLELTLSLSSILAKVSQFHTLCTGEYVRDFTFNCKESVSAHKSQNTGCTNHFSTCVVVSEHISKQRKALLKHVRCFSAREKQQFRGLRWAVEGSPCPTGCGV